MSIVFEQLLTPAMGDASYLVGDDDAHACAIVDPQVDIERYLSAARAHGLAIRFIVQTHVHEDFVSGAAALAAACGTAEVCVGGRNAPAYGFAHRRVTDGTTLDIGATRLTVRETPGHTPEHIALLVSEADQPDAPFAVLSGGSLLVGAAGRTDLLGPERTDALTHAQFDTLRSVFLSLDDGVLVYPTHVHGSPCGAAIGDRTVSTIGYERRHNPLLQPLVYEDFRKAALDPLPPRPSYYPRLKEVNTRGDGKPPALHGIRALPPADFQSEADNGKALVLDTRRMLAFGGGHIPGALNIGAEGHFSIQAGWMLDPARPLLLVLDAPGRLGAVVGDLARAGLREVSGWLAGGMSAWEDAGLPLAHIPQMHVRQLSQAMQEDREQLMAVDVRSPQEWDKGHVPGARHVFLPELPRQLDSLPRERRIAVYCDSGYRASIAASLLRAQGFDVANVPGSWQAWQALRLPHEK